MISKAEFRRRVQENTEYFQRNYKKSLDISRYHFFDVAAGEQAPLSLMDKVHDIMTSVAVGALPLTNKSGADAMMLIDGEITPVEMKFCTIDSNNYTVGPQGGIYVTSGNSRIALSMSITARWRIGSDDHLKTKKRHTILVVFDRATNEFVDARQLTGAQTLRLLMGVSEAGKQGKARSLSWKSFDENGAPMKLVVPCMTYVGLQKLIFENEIRQLHYLKEKNGWGSIQSELQVIDQKLAELV